MACETVVTPALSPVAPMSSGRVVLVLSLLLGLQPITTDLYLPALPGLTQDLHATMAQETLFPTP